MRPATSLAMLALLGAALMAACGGEQAAEPDQPAPDAGAPREAPTPDPTPAPNPTPSVSLPITDDTLAAPRISGEGINDWINSEELTFEGLQSENKVVLVDFWTYTCINCIRTLPYLKQWHDRYADSGLVIVGVHTPEFEFEKSLDNVREAVARFEIDYPIVLDNNYWTWNAFNNRYWPAKYLIDVDGNIRYTHFGEGKYDETEQAIRLLLLEADRAIEDVSARQDMTRRIDPNARSSQSPDGLTRELYAGADRNYNAFLSGRYAPYVLQDEFYDQPHLEVDYADPGDHQNHHLYLQGLWFNGDESLTHARTTQDFEDHMALRFNAVEVNVVLRTRSDDPYTVRLMMDGRTLAPEEAGEDVWFDDDGVSFITVNEPRLYALVRLKAFEGHELALSSNSDEFEVFAFTFGAYVDHPET